MLHFAHFSLPVHHLGEDLLVSNDAALREEYAIGLLPHHGEQVSQSLHAGGDCVELESVGPSMGIFVIDCEEVEAGNVLPVGNWFGDDLHGGESLFDEGEQG